MSEEYNLLVGSITASQVGMPRICSPVLSENYDVFRQSSWIVRESFMVDIRLGLKSVGANQQAQHKTARMIY